MIQGPDITENKTRHTDGLNCVASKIDISKRLRVAVDAIPDKTGKVNSAEGYKVTQGVESMAITALAKIPAVQVVERRNVEAFNMETELTDKKRIGDGQKYPLSNGRTLNYRPLLTGKVNGADYYITGAITEVNYNIHSGGQILDVSGLSFGKKTVVMNVALDLRIVDVKTLDVIDAVTLQKQFVGLRTQNGLYRFIDKELVSFDNGASTDEPLQLGIRSLVERGVSRLVGKLFNVETEHCFEAPIQPEIYPVRSDRYSRSNAYFPSPTPEAVSYSDSQYEGTTTPTYRGYNEKYNYSSTL
jgi:curli biogenesis system outer membrane secretion channel CsgG